MGQLLKSHWDHLAKPFIYILAHSTHSFTPFCNLPYYLTHSFVPLVIYLLTCEFIYTHSSCIGPLISSLIYSLSMHWLIHIFMYSLAHKYIHELIQALVELLTDSLFVYLLSPLFIGTHSLIHLFISAFVILSLTCPKSPCIHSFIHPPTHSCAICSFSYSLIHFLSIPYLTCAFIHSLNFFILH